MMKSILDKKDRILISMCVAFLICIFAPLEIYIANINEFFFSIYDLLPYCVLAFVLLTIMSIVFAIILGRINRSLEYGYLVMIAVFTVAIHIQGNFMPAGYGQLDGSVIEWSKFKTEAIASIVLWLLALVIVFIFITKKKNNTLKILRIVVICVVLMQTVTLLTITLSNNAFRHNDISVATKEDEMNLSSNRNLIVLIVDSLDSRMFSQVINDDFDKYSKIFEDFTYCKDTTGMYLFTELAVPHIISGEQYDSKLTYKEYINSVYNNSPVLNYAQDNGIDIGVYTNSQGPIGSVGVNVKNYQSVKLGVSSHRRLLGYIYKLVGFKYLPFHLKQFCWFYPDVIEDLRTMEDSDAELYDWNNHNFYNDFDRISSNNPKDALRIYHVKGAHAPFHITAEFEEIDGETTYYDDTKGVLIMVDEFIDRLKEEGVYDNSAIIILADHGYEGYRQNPTLMMKGIEEHHQFEINPAPMTYEDIQRIALDLFNGNLSEDIIGNYEVGEKTRRFVFHTRDYSSSFSEQHFDIYEYCVKGAAWEDEKTQSVDGYDYFVEQKE